MYGDCSRVSNGEVFKITCNFYNMWGSKYKYVGKKLSCGGACCIWCKEFGIKYKVDLHPQLAGYKTNVLKRLNDVTTKETGLSDCHEMVCFATK